ncbi:MAG: hypothetical protein ACKO7D_10675 [Bacteroidota bacterium]
MDMLKYYFSFLAFFLFSQLNSQVWFDIGLNGAFGTGFLTDPKIYSDSRFNFSPQINNSFALKIGVNPSEIHSGVIELSASNRSYGIDQASIPSADPNVQFFEKINFSGFQAALLYRKTQDATFLEFGPMWSKITSQELKDDYSKTTINSSVIHDQNLKLVAGIGGFITGTERVSFVAGIRFLYDLTDLRAKTDMGQIFPFQNYNDASLSKSQRAFDIQLNFELNVSLGFLYRKSCGKRNVAFKW